MPLLGGRSVSWSANMSSNRRNLKASFLTNRCLYWRGRSASWLANMSSNRRNLKSPFLTTRCLYQGGNLPVDWPIWALTEEISSHHSWPLDTYTRGESTRWLANISSNSRKLKSPCLTSRYLSWRGISASWMANISSTGRNFKSPFLTIRCLCWGVDQPVNKLMWGLTVEISSHHSWPLDASTGG